MVCLKCAGEFGGELLQNYLGFAPPAPAQAAQVQAVAKPLPAMCVRFACGVAWDLLVIRKGFAPPVTARAAQAQARAGDLHVM